jgi:outer membrane protein assembly factor BamB
MGIFPFMLMIWVYTAVLVLFAVCSLVGVFKATHPWAKGIWGAFCILAILVLAGTYLTGFTFHLNASAPVSSDRLVYLIPSCLCAPDSNVQNGLVAVRVRDGQVQWRHVTQGINVIAFASDDQRVYVLEKRLNTNDQGYILTALDAHSGHQTWQVTSEIGGRLLGVSDGRLTLANSQTTFILDANTGKELLRVPVADAYFEQGGILYACAGFNSDLMITATDEITGRTLWTSPPVFGCGLALTSTVLIAQGNGMLTAIRIKDGSLLWQVNEGGPSSDLCIDGATLFTTVHKIPYRNGNGLVTARSISGGSLLWRKTLGNYPSLGGFMDNSVLVTDTASTIPLVALRGSDGKQLWSFPQAYGSPYVETIVDGVVILSWSTSRQIMAIDLHTGSFYWQTTL